jgi:hypothetical protein
MGMFAERLNLGSSDWCILIGQLPKVPSCWAAGEWGSAARYYGWRLMDRMGLLTYSLDNELTLHGTTATKHRSQRRTIRPVTLCFESRDF